MNIATPGMGRDIKALERRLATLERDLSQFRGVDATLETDQGTGRYQVLARNMGAADNLPPHFQLGREKKGATIYYGAFLSAIQFVSLGTTPILDYGVMGVGSQEKIYGPTIMVPDNFTGHERWKPLSLNFFGEVWISWRCDTEGKITELKISDEPLEDDPIPALVIVGPYAQRSREDGTYRLKIGKVPEKERIEQDILGDIYWSPTIFNLGCV